ncbi:MAG: divalent-cation tolerance protein CutA [Proteobacteria bacterium]|nr:divalent-cation tolerance protein CutA [Pseudomonadota bacterium]
MDTEYLQVATTTDSQPEAEKLITVLVEKRIAACAQVQGPEILPPKSQPPTDDNRKWRCKFKTSKELYGDVEEELKRFFRDNPPEIRTLPIVKGSTVFFRWLDSQLQPE